MYKMFPVSFTMNQDTLDDLERLAKEHDCSRSKMVRKLIAGAIAHHKLIDPSPSYVVEPAR